MRILVLIFALIGAAGSGFVGFASYAAKQKAEKEGRRLDPERVKHLDRAMYGLIAGVPLGVIGGILAMSRKKFLAAIILLVAYAVPVTILALGLNIDFSDDAVKLIVLLPAGLAVAGLLSLLIKPGVPYKAPGKQPYISEDDDMVG